MSAPDEQTCDWRTGILVLTRTGPAQIPQRSEPLTCSSPIRYAVARARAPDAIRSIATARVYGAARRRSGVAARGARAAGGDAGDRLPQHPIARRVRGAAAWVPPGPERRGLCRGRERRDRIQLGRESNR